jgi:hypothetical protein
MNYSRIIGEAPMDMVKPSEMVSRLDLVVLELAAAGMVFRRLPEGFWDFRVFIEQIKEEETSPSRTCAELGGVVRSALDRLDHD